MAEMAKDILEKGKKLITGETEEQERIGEQMTGEEGPQKSGEQKLPSEAAKESSSLPAGREEQKPIGEHMKQEEKAGAPITTGEQAKSKPIGEHKQEEKAGAPITSTSEQKSVGKDKIPEKMKAMRVVNFGKPLEIQEIDVPKPGPKQVLVQVTMCGVCHTDLHMRTGDLPNLKPESLPQTLGHEGVGKVVKNGPGCHMFKEGDRVCLNVLSDACLNCMECLSGWETACSEAKLAGCHEDGHYAQFFVAKEDLLCPIPDEVSDEEAAPLNCGGITSYKALKVSALRAGQWVVLVGAAGGLGYYAIQFAKAMGLKVIAVDRGEEKMDWLKQFDGIHCLDADKENITDKVMKLTKDEGAHGAVIIAPSNEAFEAAPNFLRHRGKLIVVGQPPPSSKFDMTTLVMKMINMTGSMVGSRLDLLEALQFVADGVVKSEPTVRDFNDVNDILDDISKLKVVGRNVVRIPAPDQWEDTEAKRIKDEKNAAASLDKRLNLVAEVFGPVLVAILIALVFMYTNYGRPKIGLFDGY